MPGLPRANYMPYPFQIVQGQKDILFVYEYASSNRIVHMSNHTEAPVDSWMGWSNGKWDGDTLVDRGEGLQRSVLVRPRRQPPQRRAEGHRALSRCRAVTTS